MMNYASITIAAIAGLLALLPCGAVAEVLRYQCRVTGLAGGTLEVELGEASNAPVQIRLKDRGTLKAAINLPTSEYQLNMVKGDATCTGNKIEIMSQAPFSAAETKLLFRYGKGKMILKKVTFGDPSEACVKRARHLLRSGKVMQAVKLLNGDIQYRAQYIEPSLAREVLHRAHISALKSHKAGDTKVAAALLGEALEFYYENARDDEHAGVDQGLVSAENDYGFFLYSLKQFKDAGKVLNHVVQRAPGRLVAHLNLADCLWELGNRNGALMEYRIYTSSVPRDKWPTRVRIRCSQ